jgi:hypothetical protein
VAEEGKAYPKVRIEEEAADLKNCLSDQDGTDEKYASKEKLMNGVETVKLQMVGHEIILVTGCIVI